MTISDDMGTSTGTCPFPRGVTSSGEKVTSFHDMTFSGSELQDKYPGIKFPLIAIGLVRSVVVLHKYPALKKLTTAIICTNASQAQSWVYTWERSNKREWRDISHQDVCNVIKDVQLVATMRRPHDGSYLDHTHYSGCDFIHVDPQTGKITKYGLNTEQQLIQM
jgi:hypothetical protein